jgi:hypothetical protein
MTMILEGVPVYAAHLSSNPILWHSAGMFSSFCSLGLCAHTHLQCHCQPGTWHAMCMRDVFSNMLCIIKLTIHSSTGSDSSSSDTT